MFKKKSEHHPDAIIGREGAFALVRGLGEALGPDYCILFYRLNDDGEARVVAATNAALLDLAAGDAAPPADQAGIAACRAADAPPTLPYFSTTATGRRLRSTLVRVDAAGFLALHYDLAQAALLQDLVARLTGGPPPAPADAAPAADGPVGQGLQRAAKRLGKPLGYASKIEKIQVVEGLDREGFFLFKGAVEALAQELGNTKYTIYAYLRETRMRSAD